MITKLQKKIVQLSLLSAIVALLLVACGGAPTAEPEAAIEEEPAIEEAAEEMEAETEEMADADDADSDDMAMAEDINVFFQMPTANAIVPPTFTVEMGALGVAVDPAGEILENSGHMHILVDTDFIPAGEVIPNDEQHLHFGDASTSTELTLSPGSHTLRLQLANGAHIALDGDQYRDEIVITVSENAAAQSVRFASPLTGATVPPTFNINMAAAGLIVEPAGEITELGGHMHILVNTDFIPAGDVIPSDEQHLHYGKAQLDTELTLEPGEHTLRLQFANGAHIALEGDQYRDEIVINVAEDAAAQSVSFVAPLDGSEVSETFTVNMTAAGLFVEGAGAVLRGTGGHMHILINTDFIEPGSVVPSDEQHLHFGGGQTSAEITLPEGEHTLRLQMANGAHLALEGDQYRDEITITVGDEY